VRLLVNAAVESTAGCVPVWHAATARGIGAAQHLL